MEILETEKVYNEYKLFNKYIHNQIPLNVINWLFEGSQRTFKIGSIKKIILQYLLIK